MDIYREIERERERERGVWKERERGLERERESDAFSREIIESCSSSRSLTDKEL